MGMNLIWLLISAVSGVMILIFIRNNCGTKLTAADYREDLIYSYYNKKMKMIEENEMKMNEENKMNMVTIPHVNGEITRDELIANLKDLYVKLEEIKDPISFSEDWFKAFKYSEKIKNIKMLLQVLD